MPHPIEGDRTNDSQRCSSSGISASDSPHACSIHDAPPSFESTPVPTKTPLKHNTTQHRAYSKAYTSGTGYTRVARGTGTGALRVTPYGAPFIRPRYLVHSPPNTSITPILIGTDANLGKRAGVGRARTQQSNASTQEKNNPKYPGRGIVIIVRSPPPPFGSHPPTHPPAKGSLLSTFADWSRTCHQERRRDC